MLATVCIQAMIWPPKVFPWWFAWGGRTSSVLWTWVCSVETASFSSQVSETQHQCINERFQWKTHPVKRAVCFRQWKKKNRKAQKSLVVCRGSSKRLNICSVLPGAAVAASRQCILCQGELLSWGQEQFLCPCVPVRAVPVSLCPVPVSLCQGQFLCPCVPLSVSLCLSPCVPVSCVPVRAVPAGQQQPKPHHVLFRVFRAASTAPSGAVRAVQHQLKCLSKTLHCVWWAPVQMCFIKVRAGHNYLILLRSLWLSETTPNRGDKWGSGPVTTLCYLSISDVTFKCSAIHPHSNLNYFQWCFTAKDLGMRLRQVILKVAICARCCLTWMVLLTYAIIN